jgi:hypothetical protein
LDKIGEEVSAVWQLRRSEALVAGDVSSYVNFVEAPLSEWDKSGGIDW